MGKERDETEVKERTISLLWERVPNVICKYSNTKQINFDSSLL